MRRELCNARDGYRLLFQTFQVVCDLKQALNHLRNNLLSRALAASQVAVVLRRPLAQFQWLSETPGGAPIDTEGAHPANCRI